MRQEGLRVFQAAAAEAGLEVGQIDCCTCRQVALPSGREVRQFDSCTCGRKVSLLDVSLSEATTASGGRRRAGDVNMEASGDGSVEIDAEDEEEAEEGAPACISAANGFRERARYLRTLREVRANDPFFAKEAAAANVTTDAAAGGGRRTGVKMAASDATSDAASGDAVAGADGNDPTLNPLPDEAFEVRTSIDPRRGQGLFARRHVEAGRFLFDYEGEV